MANADDLRRRSESRTVVLIVFCVLLPFGLPWLGLALWFFFGR